MSKNLIKQVKIKLSEVSRTLTNVIAVVALGTALAACVPSNHAPVLKPCGVIVDSLADVQGVTPEDNKRIDAHFERGVRAACWPRVQPTRG